MKIQEEQLHSRTAELRLNIQKFDSFLRENESKKARAAKKTWEERKLRDGKERELQTMKDKLESLNSEVELQKKRMSLCKHRWNSSLGSQCYIHSTALSKFLGFRGGKHWR